mgnify:CR=1 FL=1
MRSAGRASSTARALSGSAGAGAAAFRGGEIATHGDHRIAMSFAMAALRASGPVLIRDTLNVATSFPGFPALAAKAGVGISETDAS